MTPFPETSTSFDPNSRDAWRSLSARQRAYILTQLNERELEDINANWKLFAHDHQVPLQLAPNGAPWLTWLLIGGRGAGKTRAGAEWVRAQALGLAPFADAPMTNIALVGELTLECAALRGVLIHDSWFLDQRPRRDQHNDRRNRASGQLLGVPVRCAGRLYQRTDAVENVARNRSGRAKCAGPAGQQGCEEKVIRSRPAVHSSFTPAPFMLASRNRYSRRVNCAFSSLKTIPI